MCFVLKCVLCVTVTVSTSMLMFLFISISLLCSCWSYANVLLSLVLFVNRRDYWNFVKLIILFPVGAHRCVFPVEPVHATTATLYRSLFSGRTEKIIV